MVYSLHFFATTGEESGQAAINRFLDELAVPGRPVLSEWLGPFADEVAVTGSPHPTQTGQPRRTG